MTFPRITHINDVLPYVTGRQDFDIKNRPGYTAIDYLFADETTFSGEGAEIRRECRGIKFHPDGRIMARPLHKFMNVGQDEDSQPHALPWDQPHHILDKLDGSMINFAFVNSELRLMTRAGITDVSNQAEAWLNEDCRRLQRYSELAHAMEHAGLTPIFEFVSPQNRIVVRYDESNLILTAIRHKVSGEYYSDEGMRVTAAAFGIPVVQAWGGSTEDVAAFIEYTRGILGSEGFVVRWNDGHMVKLKSDEYVRFHRAKDGLQHEKNVLSLVLAGNEDDVIPLLPPEDAERLRLYASEVRWNLLNKAMEITEFAYPHRLGGRKDFATLRLPGLPRLYHAAAWAVFDDKDALTALKALIMRHLGSQTQVDEIRDLIGVKWNA